jgi:branched-chain amino acid aminotransferase
MLWSRWARPAPNTAPTQAKASGLYMICTMAKRWAEAQDRAVGKKVAATAA